MGNHQHLRGRCLWHLEGFVLLGYIASEFASIESPAGSLTCPRCKAEVPLLDSRGAQCLYCLKGIPVSAGRLESAGSHSQLRTRLHSELAEVREVGGARGAAWTFALASVVLAGVLGALVMFGVGYLGIGGIPEGLFIAGGLLCGAVLFVSSTSMFVRRLWRLASVPYARLAATGVVSEGSLKAFCTSCYEELPLGGEAVVECKSCGTHNLLPAPLVPKVHRPQYVAVLGRRLQTGSLGTARAIAKTHTEELVGWVVVGVGGCFALVWSGWASLASAPDFLRDPVASVGIPVFAAVVFAGFGVQTILAARKWRHHLTDRTK